MVVDLNNHFFQFTFVDRTQARYVLNCISHSKNYKVFSSSVDFTSVVINGKNFPQFDLTKTFLYFFDGNMNKQKVSV